MEKIVKYKPFELYLEEVTNINSDREVKLKNYQDTIKEFNAKKNSFKTVFTKDEQDWEKEANKIINGNVYLGTMWKITKMQNDIDKMNAQIKSNELSDAEVKDINDTLKEQTMELNKEKNAFVRKMAKDLNDIKTK